MLSGVHATLAGVLGAFSVPAMPKYNPGHFNQRIRDLMEKFESSYQKDKTIMKNEELQGIVSSLEKGVLNVQTMSLRLEHLWHMPVAYLIIPIFVLVNAGIPIEFSSFAETLTNPVALGISAGLILGKFIGIPCFPFTKSYLLECSEESLKRRSPAKKPQLYPSDSFFFITLINRVLVKRKFRMQCKLERKL